jgi:hypothetical protein
MRCSRPHTKSYPNNHSHIFLPVQVVLQVVSQGAEAFEASSVAELPLRMADQSEHCGTVLFLYTLISGQDRARRHPVQLEVQLRYNRMKDNKSIAHLPWSAGEDCDGPWTCVPREEPSFEPSLQRNRLGLAYWWAVS